MSVTSRINAIVATSRSGNVNAVSLGGERTQAYNEEAGFASMASSHNLHARPTLLAKVTAPDAAYADPMLQITGGDHGAVARSLMGQAHAMSSATSVALMARHYPPPSASKSDG